MTSVSIVIPAYNAEKILGKCLRAVCGQDVPQRDVEVIVVDDGSTDATPEVAESFGVRVLRRPNGGAGAARNAGWRAAKGEWVAFTDSDCMPARSWLRALVNAAETKATTAVGAAGKTVGFESRTAAARFCDISGSLDAERHLAHPKFPFAPSANLMYRRTALEEVNGFDERYVTYEACDLHWRIMRAVGGSFVYEPRALVFHRHREDWKAFWRQQYAYGVGYGQFVLGHRNECDWTITNELREWGDIGRLGLTAWLPPKNDTLLYRRGLFVKKFAQRLGFMKTQWSRKERERW